MTNSLLTLTLFGLISLLWVGSGVTMIGAPSWWAKTIRRWTSNPSYRFLLTQATVLIGLILLLGTSGHQGYWLWVTIGSLGILKGLIFLAAPEWVHTQWLEWWEKVPGWAMRLVGFLLVVLATLLAIDSLRRIL